MSPGVNVAISRCTTASSKAALGTLEGITDYGDNYGERIRGYLTAPATGQLLLLDRRERLGRAVDLERQRAGQQGPARFCFRANGSAPARANGTLQPNQKSGWLALVAGQRYYVEDSAQGRPGTDDHWAVAWLLDPTGTNNTPSGVVPRLRSVALLPAADFGRAGHALQRNMLPPAGVTSTGFGTATLRLSADNSQAVLKFSYQRPHRDRHRRAYPQRSRTWATRARSCSTSRPPPRSPMAATFGTSARSAASPQSDVIQILNEGKAYITILQRQLSRRRAHRPLRAGQGHQLVHCRRRRLPAWTDDHANASAAARFLIQATFGPSPGEVACVQSLGYANWIDNQFSLPATRHLPLDPGQSESPTRRRFIRATLVFNDWWQSSITAPDQLRQRVAFALSEIMVVSEVGVLQNNGRALTSYYDTLLDHAFGNFRALLKAVTLTPAMGLYLDMRANQQRQPDHRHAPERELCAGNPAVVLDRPQPPLARRHAGHGFDRQSRAHLRPGRDHGLRRRSFTGWNYYQPNQANGRLPTGFSPSANYTDPMVLVPVAP